MYILSLHSFELNKKNKIWLKRVTHKYILILFQHIVSATLTADMRIFNTDE